MSVRSWLRALIVKWRIKMGLYFEDDDKRAWLKQNGEMVSEGEGHSHIDYDLIPTGKTLVCLVDNYYFFAAGIAYCNREFMHFDIPDGRPKEWYLVDTELIAPKCPMWNEYMEFM